MKVQKTGGVLEEYHRRQSHRRRLGRFSLEVTSRRTVWQKFIRPAGEDGSLSGSTRRGFAEGPHSHEGHHRANSLHLRLAPTRSDGLASELTNVYGCCGQWWGFWFWILTVKGWRHPAPPPLFHYCNYFRNITFLKLIYI